MAKTLAHKAAMKAKQNVLDQWGELKRARTPWEQVWREASDYLLPRRNTDAIEVPGALHPRRVVDNTGVIYADRLASTLSGFLVSPFSPFIGPKLNDGEPDRDAALWFDDVSNIMFRHLSGSTSTFRVQLPETMLDAVALGTSVTFVGSRDFAAPFYQTLPIRSVWIDDDPETQRVNRVFRKFALPLWRAVERFPDSQALKDLIAKPKADRQAKQYFLHAVYPRAGGALGAAAHNKPFADVTIHLDSEELVDASGWDSMPFAVSRFQRVAGQAYGYGPGIQALPLVKGLNVLLDTVILQAEHIADPTLLDYTGGQINQIDRRPGATIPVDPTLWRTRADRPLEPLLTPADLRPAKDIIEDFRAQIRFTMFVDWMQLRENGNMTATEVIDRRELRLRTMAPVVARMEQEMLNPIAERTFALMQRANMFPPPPESLVGREISFEYTSPLAMAQRQAENENFLRTIEFAAGAAQADATAVQQINIGEMVRKAAKNYGVSEAYLVDRAQLRAAQAATQAQTEIDTALSQASVAAGAAQQGAQAAASLGNAEAAA